MMNKLALINPSDFGTLSQIAKIACGSGYVKSNEQQAMFVILKGVELGIMPLQALDTINVIQGKPTASPQLMLALINRSGELQDMKIDSTDTGCTVTMTRKGRTPHIETFSLEDAKRMGLAGKDNWTKQPRTMLKWRGVAACARVVFPDVIQGLYTPEEMGADVIEDDSGEVVIVENRPTVQSQIPATVPSAEPPPPEEVAWTDAEAETFIARQLAAGLTQADIMTALGVKTRSEWKRSAAAADQAMQDYVAKMTDKSATPVGK